MTKTTLTNTTKPPQHPSHNTSHKHNQNSYTLQHKHNQTNTIKPKHITTSTNNIATTSHPMPLLFHKEINPAIMELLLQHGNQSRHHRYTVHHRCIKTKRHTLQLSLKFYSCSQFIIFCECFLIPSLCNQWTTTPHADLPFFNKTITNLPYWSLVPNLLHLSCLGIISKNLTAWTIYCITCIPNTL